MRRAGVARKTLYDNFDGKEDLFLAPSTPSSRKPRARSKRPATETDGGWQQRVEAGLAALLAFVAERPQAARMCMVESLSATPAASARYDAALRRVRRAADSATHRPATGLPETIEETLVGGVAWVLSQQIRRGGRRAGAELLPELSEFVLSPYHGVAEIGSQPRGESDSTVADFNA